MGTSRMFFDSTIRLPKSKAPNTQAEHSAISNILQNEKWKIRAVAGFSRTFYLREGEREERERDFGCDRDSYKILDTDNKLFS